MQEIGTIKAIYRYPVKSMAGQSLGSATAGWHGLEGDRRFAFVRVGVQNGFPWLSASKLPRLLQYRPLPTQNHSLPTHVRTPEGRELELRGQALQQEISEAFGAPVEMMQLKQGIFDEAQISIISTSTIQAIAEEAGTGLEVERFRPNVLIETAEGKAFGEDEWLGKVLWIGEGAARVGFNVYMKDVRCIMINLDPATAKANPAVLKAAVRMNGNNAGVYAMVMRTGGVSVGDKVYLQEV